MSDRLSLSLWLRGGVTPQNQYRALDKLLRAFPFSKLSTTPSTLLIMAVDWTEPPVAEYPLESPPDVDEVIRLAREFTEPDTALQLDTYWDLWGMLDKDWKLLPAPVSIFMFGRGFDSGSREEDLRIDFGPEARFLPERDGSALRMVQSNIKSLLRLVHELDNILPVERRQLSTESHVNFSERLEQVLTTL